MTDNPQVPSPASALRAEVEAVAEIVEAMRASDPDGMMVLRAKIETLESIISNGPHHYESISAVGRMAMWKKTKEEQREAILAYFATRFLRRCADRLREMEGELDMEIRRSDSIARINEANESALAVWYDRANTERAKCIAAMCWRCGAGEKVYLNGIGTWSHSMEHPCAASPLHYDRTPAAAGGAG